MTLEISVRKSKTTFNIVYFGNIKGPDNIEADALSRLPFEEKKSGPSVPVEPTDDGENINNSVTCTKTKSNDVSFLPNYIR